MEKLEPMDKINEKLDKMLMDVTLSKEDIKGNKTDIC